LIVNAVSFLLSAISEMFIHIPKNNNKPKKINLQVFKKDLMEGINIIRNNKYISTIIGLGTIINFSIAPLFSIGLIFIIKEILMATDFQFGLFQMVISSSMIAAPLLCSSFIRKIKLGKLCFTSFLSIAILILIMTIIPSNFLLAIFIPNIFPFILLLIVTFIIGLLATIANIAIGTLFSQVVPIEMMGRTSTVFNLAVTIFIPIGQMIFGFLYDIIAPSYVIAISGLILILALLNYRTRLMMLDCRDDETIKGDVANAV